MLSMTPMKKIISTVLLLAWTASVFGAYCQNEVNSLASLDPWARMGRFRHGNHIPDFTIRPLGVQEVSSSDREVMEALERNGGKGRYIELELSHPLKLPYDAGTLKKMKGVQILSPSNEGLYGSAFAEIFKEFNEAGIPAFIYSGPELELAGGGVTIQKYGSTNSKGIFMLRPKTSNIINRHELQHLRDYITQTETFKQTLPEVSEPVMRLLERKEAKETLGEKEEKDVSCSS